ncbi:hypothetical protein B0H13DRAFT_2310606 [Mycena leptocephala]|nr:hypothetical protein B0H13DRAFT_2310606 [Mycena leptocephala]
MSESPDDDDNNDNDDTSEMSNEPTDSSKDPSEKSDAMSEKSNSSDTSDPSDPLDPQLQLIINLTGLCMVLCSSEGMVVNNACINPDLLQGWLELLPDYDWSEISIRNLLSPTDAQDLDPEDFDPGEEVEFKAFCILGEIFHALLQPFVNVELSLSEQIESLIKFANLLLLPTSCNNVACLRRQAGTSRAVGKA